MEMRIECVPMLCGGRETTTLRQLLLERLEEGRDVHEADRSIFHTCIIAFIHMYINYMWISVFIHPRIQQTFAECPHYMSLSSRAH